MLQGNMDKLRRRHMLELHRVGYSLLLSDKPVDMENKNN